VAHAQSSGDDSQAADEPVDIWAGYEPIEVARLKFEAFNDGFEGDSIALNFTNCNNQMLVMNYLERPTLRAKLYYANGEEYLKNSTTFLKNASFPLNYCTDTAQQFYYFVQTQQDLYGSTGGFARAAMLNIFSNAIRVQQITRRLQTL
jgi:hypothetical protein